MKMIRKFNSVQEIHAERDAQRNNKTIYTLLGVLIGELDRLPTREDPTPDMIYTVINRMYNNAREMAAYKSEAQIEVDYLGQFIKRQLTDAEIVEIIMQYKEDGLTTLGDIMRAMSMKYKGQYDGRTVSMMINQILKG
jgi:uncharacterized protein YqeY